MESTKRLLFSLCLVAAAGVLSQAEEESISPEDLAKVKAAQAARIQAIEKVYPTVVCIYGNNRKGGGSGVLYDPAGFALTNFHVIQGSGKEGWAGLADGKLYRWKLVGFDPGGDLAIIRLEGKNNFPAAMLGNSDNVLVGDWVMAMGNPFALAEDQRPTVTLGIVSGIKRYQYGAGKNTLVYGNCIQVDSSINPGNSGGPLFNLQGQVIGINGRASFHQRGRVNVGVGYAISVTQVKNFIPDLLATKTSMHGTLDALFGDRRAGVLCEKLNLDAKIAKLGLNLGDRLIAFDSQRITSANQFTNLISTLPARWPVEVVFEHNDKIRSVWLRLTPLPYGKKPFSAKRRIPIPKKTPKGKDQDEEKKKKAIKKIEFRNLEKEDSEKDGGEAKKTDGKKKVASGKKDSKEKKGIKKDKKPTMKPTEKIIVISKPKVTPGKIRDTKMNKRHADLLIERWTAFKGKAKDQKKIKAFQLDEDFFIGGFKIGSQRLLWSADGKLLAIQSRDPTLVNLSPLVHLQANPSEPRFDIPYVQPDGKIVYEPRAKPKQLLPATAFIGSALFQALSAKDFTDIRFQGGDKAAGQRAYRFGVNDKEGRRMLLWLSVLNDSGQFETRLLKIAQVKEKGSYEDDPEYAVTFGDYRSVRGLMLPHRRRLVKGLSEAVVYEIITTKIETLEKLPKSAFKKAKDEQRASEKPNEKPNVDKRKPKEKSSK